MYPELAFGGRGEKKDLSFRRLADRSFLILGKILFILKERKGAGAQRRLKHYF